MSPPHDHFVLLEASNLLVVDDDPILREFASVHLSTPSTEIMSAENGEVGLSMIKTYGFDLALIDLEMPVMDGFSLIEILRADERFEHLPIIVISGREDMSAIDRAFAVGATSFVIKPINWRSLLHQIAYVLKNARREASIRRQLTEAMRLCSLKTDMLMAMNKTLGSTLDEVSQNHDVSNKSLAPLKKFKTDLECALSLLPEAFLP